MAGRFPPEIWIHVIDFCDAKEAVNAIVNRCLRDIVRRDMYWQKLCQKYGLSQVSVTRTRGRKEWKRVYLDHLCIECKNVNFGIIIMDTNGGCNTRYRGIDNPSTSLVPVCLKCFDEVSVVPLKDRSKACLMKSKVRISDFARNSLLNKIPYNTRDKKRKPETRVGAKNRSQDFNCPDENDDLALKQCRRALR